MSHFKDKSVTRFVILGSCHIDFYTLYFWVYYRGIIIHLFILFPHSKYFSASYLQGTVLGAKSMVVYQSFLPQKAYSLLIEILVNK